MRHNLHLFPETICSTNWTRLNIFSAWIWCKSCLELFRSSASCSFCSVLLFFSILFREGLKEGFRLDLWQWRSAWLCHRCMEILICWVAVWGLLLPEWVSSSTDGCLWGLCWTPSCLCGSQWSLPLLPATCKLKNDSSCLKNNDYGRRFKLSISIKFWTNTDTLASTIKKQVYLVQGMSGDSSWID